MAHFPPLIKNQVRQNRKTIEENSLAAFFVMKAFHHKQLSVHSVVELVYQRRRPGDIRIFKQNVPSGLFLLNPFPHPTPILLSR